MKGYNGIHINNEDYRRISGWGIYSSYILRLIPKLLVKAINEFLDA